MKRLLLLPSDPDANAAALHRALEARFGCRLAVVVSDSVGRAWRHGVAGIAVGAAGLPSLVDLRGAPDLFGESLKVTLTGFADQIASAANLVAGGGRRGRTGRTRAGARMERRAVAGPSARARTRA